MPITSTTRYGSPTARTPAGLPRNSAWSMSVLGPAALEPRPSIRDAILHGIHGMAARQRPPRSRLVSPQDDILVRP